PATGRPFFDAHALRLARPDDQLGAPLLMAVPTRIVHRLDAWSLLIPPPEAWPKPPPEGQFGRAKPLTKRDATGFPESYHYPSNAHLWPDVFQRAVDADQVLSNTELLVNHCCLLAVFGAGLQKRCHL